jgi:pimeloyl-ACP methyl ester carboxylesterase
VSPLGLGGDDPAADRGRHEVGAGGSGYHARVTGGSGVATFVLVHGAGGGAWEWKKVAAYLHAAGSAAYAVTLTGCGERRHLVTAATGLDTHVADVVHAMAYEDLTGVILVGHSYGGNVITGVADAAPERLAHLVYLDANVPRDGQSLTDLAYGPTPEGRARFLARTRTRGEQWRRRCPWWPDLPAAEAPPPEDEYRRYVARGQITEAERRWFLDRLGPHPAQSYLDPVRSRDSRALALPRTFILCTDYQGPFGPFARRAQTEPGWRYRELPTGHDAQLLMARPLADLLLEAAETVPTSERPALV